MGRQKLIELADAILDCEITSPELLELMERYGAAVELWLQSPEFGAAEAADAAQLQTLGDRHGRVLELARTLSEKSSADLRSFRTRARGLLTYTDILPKVVSTRKPTKG